MNVTCSCIFHAYISFLFLSILCFGCDVFSLSLSLSWIDYVMVPKARKSTLGRNPLQGSGSSSSDLIPPLHIRFCDEKSWKDFSENFQKRGIHPKCHVILLDFSNTPLPAVIWTQGWEFLLERPLRCPIVFI